jgi:exosortase E/protease (VPEID-CTERM system)
VAAGLGGFWFAAWAVARVAGTVVVVPLVEELFFRGYLLARLDGPGPARRMLAIALSSALFGAMHERWLVAFLAGMIFALVYLRRGRLADAIAAHVVANLVVALWAVAAGDWAAL